MTDRTLLDPRPQRARDARPVRAVDEGPQEDDDPGALRDEVARVVAFEADARGRAAEAARRAAHAPQWRRIAARLCRTNSVPAAQHLDDVAAIVVETAWEMLERSRRDPAYLRSMRSFLAIVVYTARPRVRSFLAPAPAPE